MDIIYEVRDGRGTGLPIKLKKLLFETLESYSQSMIIQLLNYSELL